MIKKSEIRKSKIGKNWKIGKNKENRTISKFGANHGANERPKGEPVTVGDLKASFYKRFIKITSYYTNKTENTFQCTTARFYYAKFKILNLPLRMIGPLGVSMML